MSNNEYHTSFHVPPQVGETRRLGVTRGTVHRIRALEDKTRARALDTVMLIISHHTMCSLSRFTMPSFDFSPDPGCSPLKTILEYHF